MTKSLWNNNDKELIWFPTCEFKLNWMGLHDGFNYVSVQVAQAK